MTKTSTMLTTNEITSIRKVIKDNHLRDTCDVYDKTIVNNQGIATDTYPLTPTIANVPCRLGKLSGNTEQKYPAYTEGYVLRRLQYETNVELKTTSRVVHDGNTYEVLTVYDQHPFNSSFWAVLAMEVG